jgi:teichuronic acid biosynthesis glycosyltransferase TuaC
MKVLHVTNNYPTTNFPIFGIFVKEQIDSLTDLGIDSEVFFINGREGGGKEYLNSILRLRKHLSNFKYDLIHCHHSYSAITLLFSGRIYGKKCLLSYQNEPAREGGKLLYNILYPFLDLIILKNKSAEIKCARTIYLPNGVNTEFFKPQNKSLCKRQLGLDEGTRYIVFMDSNTKHRTQKRIDRFMATIKILKENYLISDIEPLVLTNVVRQLIPTYLCASDLHLLTSDFEGSPNSVKECLACNIPVVSTPVGNVAEIIEDINGSYVSKSFDPEELADLSIKALSNKDYTSRESIIKKGLDIKSVASRLFNAYKGLN